MGRRSALLVGTYHYSDSSLQRLRAPGRDVEALAEVLADPEIAQFDVTTLINEPHHVVGEAIGNFYDGLRRDDLAMLYISGHGVKDDRGRLFLAMTDSKRNGLLFTAIGADQINDAMNSCSSRQKVLILDCCYGGAFPSGLTAKGTTDVHTLERFQGRGRVVLTASDAAQYSFEGDTVSGAGASSLFTRYLVEGIRTGKADLDGDGDVSLDELYSYVHDRVIEAMPQQRPKKQEDIEGRIVIARNIGWSLPTHVQHAIESPLPTDRRAAVQSLSHLYRVGNSTVRHRVLAEVEKLVADDSRMVAAAATELIRTIRPEAEQPRNEPTEEQPIPPATTPTSLLPPASPPFTSSEMQPATVLPIITRPITYPPSAGGRENAPSPAGTHSSRRRWWLWGAVVSVLAIAGAICIAVLPHGQGTSGDGPGIPQSAPLPDGTLLVARDVDGVGGLYPVDGRTGLLGPRFPAVETRRPVISPDRRSIIYFLLDSTDRNSIRIAGADGTGDRELFTPRVPGCDRYLWPTWNPMQRDQIAFSCLSAAGSFSMRILNLDGSPVHEFNIHNAWVDGLSFSPDARRLAYFMGDPGNARASIYTVPTDESMPPVRLTNGFLDSAPEWSPDGSRILFQREIKPNHRMIMVMSSDGSQQQTLSGGSSDDIDPAWSPDGTTVAFRSNRDEVDPSVFRYLLMDSTGNNIRDLIPDDQAPAVSAPAWQTH
jgi:hypothetical protein